MARIVAIAWILMTIVIAVAEAITLQPPLSTKLIYQFPNPTWIENIAVRSNGQLLVTILTAPELWLVDPSTANATLVHTFEGNVGLTGIIELKPDIFYVGNSKGPLGLNGTFNVTEVDMTCFEKTSKAAIKFIANMTGVGVLNGMEILSKAKGEILMADSYNGAVWKLDVNTGKQELVIQVDEMKHDPNSTQPTGINGLKVRDGYLYWDNMEKELFCRIKIDDEGRAIGETEILETNILADDFVLDTEGNAWLAQANQNTISVVKKDGKVVLVAGESDQFTVAGATACRFGRRKVDEHVLYVVTNGDIDSPINGTSEGGKVVAINTTRFYS